MPKQVDHEERRQSIAAALLRVVSRDGLDAVSLRHVATEAGVTAGMVQHYFPSKADMVHYAMTVSSGRYEQRIGERLAELGADAEPLAVVRILVGSLIPTSEVESEDARIALAFQAHAANNPAAAALLAEGNHLLVGHLAELLGSVGAGGRDAPVTATALLATAEGLAVATLSAGLSSEDAVRALEAHLEVLAGAR